LEVSVKARKTKSSGISLCDGLAITMNEMLLALLSYLDSTKINYR